MSNLLLIAFCLLAGVFARQTKRLPSQTPAVLGRLIIDIALPALTLLSVRTIRIPSGGFASLLMPILMPWGQFLFAVGGIVLLGRWRGWSRGTIGALVLTVGLGNTSFVGFPLVEALYGREGLATAVVVDQSSFFVMSTLALLTAPLARGEAPPRARELGRRLVMFPPFLAFVVALLSRPFALPTWLVPVIERLGGLVVPLALLSVGFQLRIDVAIVRRVAGRLAAGLTLKLVAWPLLTCAVVRYALHQRGLLPDVTIIEAAMAPMVTAAVLATEADLEPELANLMVGIGVPVSMITVVLWRWVLDAV